MTPTTLVMAYYENPGMLREHFKRLNALPLKMLDQLHVVIVDDGSPEHPAEAPARTAVSLQIYRIDVDVRWNQDAARNIGVQHAETNWVLLTDIDHIVPEGTWDVVLNRNWDPDVAYKFGRVSLPELDPYKPHPNSWLMARTLYDRAGGYDERFAGLYGTDGDFRDRVHEHAKEVRMIKEPIIRVPRQVIPDASTTTYLRKQPEDKEGLKRVRAERAAEDDKTPKRFSFPYHRVYP
jgi:hypothetical protein